MPLSQEDFENELRAALRRESPPPDFAAKVSARAAGESLGKRPLPLPMWRRPVSWALAAALLLCALVPPAISEYNAQRRERGLEARRQLIVALRITNVKLRQTRQQIQHPGKHVL